MACPVKCVYTRTHARTHTERERERDRGCCTCTCMRGSRGPGLGPFPLRKLKFIKFISLSKKRHRTDPTQPKPTQGKQTYALDTFRLFENVLDPRKSYHYLCHMFIHFSNTISICFHQFVSIIANTKISILLQLSPPGKSPISVEVESPGTLTVAASDWNKTVLNFFL